MQVLPVPDDRRADLGRNEKGLSVELRQRDARGIQRFVPAVFLVVVREIRGETALDDLPRTTSFPRVEDVGRAARADLDRLFGLVGLAIDACAGDMDAVAVLLVELVDQPVGVGLRGRPCGAIEILDFDRRRPGGRNANRGCRRSGADKCGRTQETPSRHIIQALGHRVFLPCTGGVRTAPPIGRYLIVRPTVEFGAGSRPSPSGRRCAMRSVT